MLSPARRRQCVDHLQAELGISERRACAVAGQHRSTQRKRPRGRDDEEALTAAIIRLASQYGRYGYRRITALLRTEGWHVNAKRVQRIWWREGLKVPQKQPKRGRLWLNDGSCIRLRPCWPNHVWSYDFVMDRIEKRGRFPSPSVRWCTSEHKRGPIQRELRRYLKDHPQFRGRLINAMGMRAEESAARARKLRWRRNDRMSVASRDVFDWLPIFDLSTRDVFRVIRDAGQSPHCAYAAGMSRLSCVFCIMASRADLHTAAQLRPALYRQYANLEERIGHTLSPSGIPLTQLTGVPL